MVWIEKDICRHCMKSCRKILMLSSFAAKCYNMRDIFLVLLYTYGTVDGSEILHQLRYIKLFKSWDIFPYQLRSNPPPTGFFHVDVYYHHRARFISEKLGPGMRMHGSRGEVGNGIRCRNKNTGVWPLLDLFLFGIVYFLPRGVQR